MNYPAKKKICGRYRRKEDTFQNFNENVFPK